MNSSLPSDFTFVTSPPPTTPFGSVTSSLSSSALSSLSSPSSSSNDTNSFDDSSLLPVLPFIDLLRSDYILVIKFVFLVILIVSTVTFNSLVILVVRTTQRLHTVSNLMFCSMAFADLLVGGVVMSFMTMYTLYGFWPFALRICTLWCIVDFSTGVIIGFHLNLIGIYRLRSILSPMTGRSRQARNKFLYLLIGAWSIPLCFYIPSIVTIMTLYPPEPQSCYFNYTASYVVPADLIFELGPMFGVAALNVAILIAVRNKERANVGKKSDAQKNIQREKRATRVLLIVTCEFIFCWMPWATFWIIEAFRPGTIPGWLYEVSYWIMYLHSTMNPLLLFTFNGNFGKALRNLFSGEKASMASETQNGNQTASVVKNEASVPDTSVIDNTRI